MQAQGVSAHLSPQTQRTQRPPEGPRRQASSEQHVPCLLSELLVTSCHSVCALLGFPTVTEMFLLKPGNSPLPSSRSNDPLHAHHLPTYLPTVKWGRPTPATQSHMHVPTPSLTNMCTHTVWKWANTWLLGCCFSTP